MDRDEGTGYGPSCPALPPLKIRAAPGAAVRKPPKPAPLARRSREEAEKMEEQQEEAKFAFFGWFFLTKHVLFGLFFVVLGTT